MDELTARRERRFDLLLIFYVREIERIHGIGPRTFGGSLGERAERLVDEGLLGREIDCLFTTPEGREALAELRPRRRR